MTILAASQDPVAQQALRLAQKPWLQLDCQNLAPSVPGYQVMIKWARVVVNHRLAGPPGDVLVSALRAMKPTTMPFKAIAPWVGGRGHHQGATGHNHHHHHHHHDNAPPAATIVDHSRTCQRMIFVGRSTKGATLSSSSTPDEKSELQLMATVSGDQIANRLKTWKKKYAKINQLRKLSAAIWDEDSFIISLDHEHYTGHLADHKSDDEYLNKPLKYYGDLATIFGNSVATGQYAKGSNDPLAFKQASETLSDAIKEVAKVGNYLPEGLFETMTSLPGFEHDHKSFYFQYLVNNAHVPRAFSSLPFNHKITFITKSKFISDNFNI
ncbi:uncharacterized protein C2845_PM06G00020 [Panicum miliaceum]|uniref:Myb/SANT-like domain-containing protein n=1 Tax=Panicum miliaceum TaxID=4540 RepID=A0A3L6R9S7_PANMI|nr:uncharacterized protein C2845_PM06G00020 [Panicum miliaceum]